MTLAFSDEQTISLPFDAVSAAESVIGQVLDQEQCPYEAQVSLTLTDNASIRELNRAYRETDRETDVLSFPMIPFAAPAEYDFLEEADDCFDPDSGELLLGDIVISVERAAAQAAEYGHSLKREYCFLIAHSMLHLLGYDHEVPEEAAVMEQKQEAALQALGITRNL